MTEPTITLRRAAEQVLESLEGELPGWRTPAQERAIVALRAALAEPEQKPEPVAWLVTTKEGRIWTVWTSPPGYGEVDLAHFNGDTITPLYTTPPEPDITKAVESAVKECIAICERKRVKILENPADPSWSEHFAQVQGDMKQRFGVNL